jgi:hypothetical protein
MLGLPLQRTIVEKALHFIGLLGAGLGLLLSGLSVISLIAGLLGFFSMAYVAPAIFFTGVTGVVFGLALAAISQGLGSLRLIAHNSANLEASQ